MVMLDPQDERLAQEIVRRLSQMPNVRLLDFNVSVANGVARLQGVAHSLADKQAAIEAASSIPGVSGVTAAIAVETPHPPRDAELSATLDEALEEDQTVDARRLGADAARGQAVLVGTGRSLGELGRAAETAEGVKNTVNVIDSSRIGNPHGADRDQLANEVADALRRHPVLRSRQIRALVEDTGKLVLMGQVQDEDEIEEALAVVTEVDGVHTVRQELEIVP
jgi:osmotically-inducible protein OsmY